MMKLMMHKLRGTLRLRLYGADLERFMTRCIQDGITFWNVCWGDETCFYTQVSAADYFLLRRHLRACSCRASVLEKQGIPFFAWRLTRRWALCLGLICCLGLLWFLSGSIWTIQVQGCRQTTEKEILELLERQGIKTGVRRANIDVKELKNKVMEETDKLSYFTINFSGVHAIVQVWERRNDSTEPEALPPCDVVSQYTGVVEDIRVRTGKALVKAGDGLAAGEPIATGVIINEMDETDVTLLHAQAEADVRLTCTLQTAVPVELYLPSGQPFIQTHWDLQAGRTRFPLGIIEKKHHSWYDKKIRRSDLKLQENFRFPLARIATDTVCFETKAARPDEQRLAAELEARLLALLHKQMPVCRIVDTTFLLEKSPQGAYMGILKADLVVTTGLEVPIG